jgi:hypothetical protein
MGGRGRRFRKLRRSAFRLRFSSQHIGGGPALTTALIGVIEPKVDAEAAIGLVDAGAFTPVLTPPTPTTGNQPSSIDPDAATAANGDESAVTSSPEATTPYYNVIGYDSQLGGAIYPFLEHTRRAWNIVTSAIADPAAYPNPATFGMDMPTLRWVNGSSLNDVFVDGMTTAQFLAATGLELHMDKGGYVLSKRLSRVMRPYFASTFLPSATVQIRYLDQDERERKVWDGAGLISRAMLERLVIPPGCSPAKREELLREIQHCQRVEFTVLSERGQDKGHALVADDLEADFVLPRDTKGEVRLGGGQTFIGVNFVHAHDEMRLDIQSLINLHPFFDEAHLMKWLEDEGQLFAQAVETGAVSEAMARIDHHTTLDDIEKWHLREYFASGGHPMWFGNMVRNLMNQHLQRLNHATLEKLRLPVPGGR